MTPAAQPVAAGAGRSLFDVVIIGAGMAGLYALHKLRAFGFSARVLEKGGGVGGVWFWNRYPGARCDAESIEYSYSFSKEIQEEWVWTDVMATQPEIEAYLNHVADRLDLRRDIQLHTTVTTMTFNEADASWTVETDRGERFTARYVIAATGVLSAAVEPDIAGSGAFQGVSLHTSRFPKEGFDFSGKRVGVIGTGSSGVQSIPVVAAQAAHLHVFQRSAAYTFPSPARPFAPGELDDLKARYDEIRAEQRASRFGAARLGAFAVMHTGMTPLKAASREEQLRAIEERGVGGAVAWSDTFTDKEANHAARQLYGEAIARVVKDPATAASLAPTYPLACKRPVVDLGYFQTFNRDNVTLVDLRKGGIERITPTGIQTTQGFFELDVILYATGFDAMTGALKRIDIRGRGGALLRDVWDTEGPVSYLGLQTAGFPNLFTITGPGSPSVMTVNLVIEDHVEWIATCLAYLRDHGHRAIEATPEAQAAWTEQTWSAAEGTVFLEPSCNSWYIGANVPGKKRVFLAYLGGIPTYRQQCAEIAVAGYRGFRLG
ncbi:MAG: NAD(P)/FAD-dependent oxidoreductase [Rhodospirillaceae bacterium]|nr:MAG: NAD(P)/FAD-dependent oxidoreductase [Rhodospirillaceae bacterium]